MQPIMSVHCTCTHGGGGHAQSCAFFTPSKEEYARVNKVLEDVRACVGPRIRDYRSAVERVRRLVGASG